MSPDDVYPVGIEHRSRAIGDGFLIDPAYVITAAQAVQEQWDAGETRVQLRVGEATVPAKVVELRPEVDLALIETSGPVRPAGPPMPIARVPALAALAAATISDLLPRFGRFQAAALRALLDGGPPPAPGSAASAGPADLLLGYLAEKAATGRLDHGVVVAASAYRDAAGEGGR